MKLRSIDILLGSAKSEQAPLCVHLGRMFAFSFFEKYGADFKKNCPEYLSFHRKSVFLYVFYPFTDVVDSIFSDVVDSLLTGLTFLLIRLAKILNWFYSSIVSAIGDGAHFGNN